MHMAVYIYDATFDIITIIVYFIIELVNLE